MGYTFDFFVAKMKCPVCNSISEKDSSTNMQTKIRSHPELAYLDLGHSVSDSDLSAKNMEQSGYLTVQTPKADEEIHILQTWECSSCGASFNWAEISIKNNVISRIQAVSLTHESLERAHFISDDCIYNVADLTNRPVKELIGSNLVELLRQYLC